MSRAQVVFRPLFEDLAFVGRCPDGANAAVRARHEDLLARWARALDIPACELQAKADPEDWSENAVVLLAALDAGLCVHILAPNRLHEPLQVVRSFGPDAFDPDAPTIFLGAPLKHDSIFPNPLLEQAPALNIIWPRNGKLGAGERYWASAVLRSALNRQNQTSSGDPGGPGGYVEATRRVLASTKRPLMAKIIFQAKYMPPTRLPLPVGREPTDSEIQSAYITAFEYCLLDCEARREAFLIQEELRFIHEYRVIIVDGEPVAGAGTVEWLSPCWHDPADGPFDPQVEHCRGDRDLVRDSDLVAQYVATARRLCRELDAEEGGGRFRNCTMDFAVNADDGSICLIETNSLDRVGIYAMDYAPVLSALLRSVSAETLLTFTA
ncbi:ATP-grasp domain-containing protein [Bosea sp. ANAM02]|uniref:ATP-grasp domain-containing protein n=1 Tax=Bosea sp. ANAM02 TaxID=2020412 RepID=UPI001565EB23|nr:ATP-grasp domain-containing protein [Bosea sp. ANAM02]